MNLNIESMSKKRTMGRKRLMVSLTTLVLVFVVIYIDNWYFAPTSPLARLPNCIRDIFSDHSKGLDISNGRISGFFATEPQDAREGGNFYTVLLFSEDGFVSVYHVSSGGVVVVETRRVLIWSELYKYPFLSPPDKPPGASKRDPKQGLSFWIFFPTKMTYDIDGEKINFTTVVDTKESKKWTGSLSNDILTFKVVYSYGWEGEEIYYYYNYDTCPLSDK